MEYDSKHLIARFDKAKSDTDAWRSTFDIIYNYIRPNTNPIDAKERSQGEIKNTHIFDTTAIKSTIEFVSKIHANLTPPFGRWAQLEAGISVNPQNRNQINALLEISTSTLFNHIHDSNFDLAINEAYYDLAIGTMALTIEEGDDDDPLIFTSFPPSEIYPEYSPICNDIKNVWREYNDLSLEEVEIQWPKAIFTKEMNDCKEQCLNQKWSFIYGCIYEYSDERYHTLVIEKNSKEIIMDLDSLSSPWVIARWSKASNEVLGRGPALDAWPAISDVNQLMRVMTLAAEYSVQPILLAYGDGVVNPRLLTLKPGQVVPISKQSANNPPIIKLDIVGDAPLTEQSIQDLRQQIRDLLFAGPLRPTMAPSQTATEISIRQQALLELIGPAFGRLERELLSKIVDRCLYILKKKGMIPPIEINNQEIMLRYRSTLAQSAQLEQVQSFENLYKVLADVNPQQAPAAIRLEQLPQWLADKMGVDNLLIKSPDEIVQMAQETANASIPPTGEVNSQTNPNGTLDFSNSKGQPLGQ